MAISLRLRSIAWSPDGKLLATGSGDSLLEQRSQRPVRLWRVADGRCLKTLHGHDSLLISIAFSQDRTIRLWDVRAGKCLGVAHLRLALRLRRCAS